MDIYIYFKKNLLQNYRTSFNQTWHKASLGRGNLDFFQIKSHAPLQGVLLKRGTENGTERKTESNGKRKFRRNTKNMHWF